MIGWLQNLDVAIDSFLDFDAMLDRIVESLRDSSGFQRVILSLLDPATETLKIRSTAGIRTEELKSLREHEVPFSQIVMFMRKELKIGNAYFLSSEAMEKVEKNQRVPKLAIETLNRKWNSRDVVLVPVDSEGGKLLGVIFVSQPMDGRIPDATKIKFLESFALSVAKAIENISFYQNARTAVKRLSTLYDVTTALGSVMKTDELFKEIVAIVREKLGYRTVGILLLDESKRYLKVRAGIGYTSLDLKSLSIHVDTDGVTGLSVKEDRPILVRDVREEPRYIGQRRPKSELAVPLRTKQGITGVLDVESEGAGSLTEDDVKLLTSLATFIAIAIDNAKLYEDIRMMADTDELTGAYNYRYLKNRLDEELEKAKKQKAKLSLLMLDLDNFKEINDSKGHSEGDHVLGILAQKLKTGLRKDDVFTRYGGDEFMVILPQTDKQEAIKIAHRIKRIVEETRLRTSIGVATYPDDSDQLIETADKALYKAKEKGKDLVYSF